MYRLASLVILFGLTLSPAVQATDYIVIVFDTSASMDQTMRKTGQTRMVTAKEALKKVLSNTPASTNVGILTFNDWVYDLQPINQQKINTAIDSLRPYGSTPLYKHIVMGADRLLIERQKSNNVGSYKLIIATDGEADESDKVINQESQFPDGSIKPAAIRDIVNRGIIIDALGIEMRSTHSLKKDINGVYMNGDDRNTIEQSLSKSVAEVGFNATDRTSKEAFETIAILPDNFAKSLIGGLTEFRNYPIQTRPPIKTPETDNKAPEGVGQEPSMLFTIVFVSIGTSVGLVVFWLLVRFLDPYYNEPVVRTSKRRRK